MNKKSITRKPKKTDVNLPQIPELITKDDVSNSSIRNFWDLFSNVKSHDWKHIIQKGNCLNAFAKLVEEMPEEQFRIIFIEPKEDKPIHIKEKVDCGCTEPCFCIREKTVRIINKYSEYLKDVNLEKYDVEIDHLRYLINLQNNGKDVPVSHSEFVKINGVINKNGSLKIEECAKSPKTEKLSDKLVNWGSKYSSIGLDIKKSQDSNARPSLTELSEVSKSKKLDEEIWNKFLKDHELYMSDSIDDVMVVAEKKSATAPPPPVSLPSLPVFWQEVESARKTLHEFDNFYARKQVELTLATRKMNEKKKEILDDTNNSGSTLHDATRAYLKAKREFEVVKKVLKTAYKELGKVQVVQVSDESMKAEMARYTTAPTVTDLSKLFDNMSPTPEVYERVVGQRKRDWMGKNESKKIARSKDKVKSEETVSPNVADKIADEIQKKIIQGSIDPDKDFPGLIEAGLGSECIDRWKEKYDANKKNESIDAFSKTDEEYFDSWKPVTANPVKVEKAISEMKQRNKDRFKDLSEVTQEALDKIKQHAKNEIKE